MPSTAIQATVPTEQPKALSDDSLLRLGRLVARIGSGALLLALATLGLRSVITFPGHWDSFTYHLPWAASLGGVPIPYETREILQLWEQGFPKLAHLVQGLLWRLTGSPTTAGAANFVAFGLFLAHCRWNLRAATWLVGLVALTAPLVVIHLATSYIDLFGNSMLAIGLSSALFLHLRPESASLRVLICGLAGLVAAAWTKPILLPVVTVAYLSYVPIVLGASGGRGPLNRSKSMIAIGALILLGAAPYLQNWVVFGNPLWPERVPLVGDLMPYALDGVSSAKTGERPWALEHASQPRLFVHSVLEIWHPTRFPHRARWIVDQGAGGYAFRSGGFWNVGAVTYLFAALALLALQGARGRVAAIAFAGLLAVNAFLPQSHELRYYLFWPLLWGAIIGLLLSREALRKPRLTLAFTAIVLFNFGYMVWENRMHYAVTPWTWQQETAERWGADLWWVQMRSGERYCTTDMAPLGLMLTGPTLTEYAVVDRPDEASCPAGTIIVRKDGVHRSPATETPKNHDQLLAAGLAQSSRGEHEAAIDSFARAALLDQSKPAVFSNLCFELALAKRYDLAILNCRRALARDPGFASAQANLAWAQGEMEKARVKTR